MILLKFSSVLKWMSNAPLVNLEILKKYFLRLPLLELLFQAIHTFILPAADVAIHREVAASIKMKSFLPKFLILSLLLLPIGCGTFSGTKEQERPSQSSLSLYESRLLDTIEKERELDAMAASNEYSTQEVQRLFLSVAQDYNAIIANNPDKIEAHLLYGKLLSRYGDLEGARTAFIAAATIDPTAAVIHQQLGNYYAEVGDPSRALAYYMNAVDFEPEEALYHFGLGDLIYAYRDQLVEEAGLDVNLLEEKMLAAFLKATEIDPGNSVYQFRYGETFYDQKDPDWEQALAHWLSLPDKISLSAVQLAAIKLHAARCLMGMKEFDEAIEMARSVTLPGLIQTRISLIDQIREAKKNAQP